MKSMCKLIYGYLAMTYATLFLGVLISDTLYAEESRILCASSVTRKFVPNIINVPTIVPWILFVGGLIMMIIAATVLKRFTLGIGIWNLVMAIYTLVIYNKELVNFFPLSLSQPTIRSAFLVIGSYLMVIASVVLIPMIVLSPEDEEVQMKDIW